MSWDDSGWKRGSICNFTFFLGERSIKKVQEDCTHLPVPVCGVVSAADVEDAEHYVKVVFGVFHKLILIDVISPM